MTPTEITQARRDALPTPYVLRNTNGYLMLDGSEGLRTHDVLMATLFWSQLDADAMRAFDDEVVPLSRAIREETGRRNRV